MHIIVIENALIKGYHKFQIRPPPPALLLPVTKEYGNRHDPHACLVWVPEIEKTPSSLWNHETDETCGERVRTINGLPTGRVPKGLSSCFYELLGSNNVERIECEQTGIPCKSFSPWPHYQSPGGGVVISCITEYKSKVIINESWKSVCRCRENG
ncbi:hypothetical protein P5673_018913 [Acropora cervicornis]|uniref:Uncharacterized protein n=1 Tax=Acropora cervicornis TaxID=6130 RepID=A0AAD9V2D6_ACRCE|nr:hypothetical protein P5673_018913 [Acropora cervicornis]